MVKVKIHLPPPKAGKTGYYKLQGSSFIDNVDSHGAHISLDTNPLKRRSQALLLAQAIEAFGPVKGIDWMPVFSREGKAVHLKLLNFTATGAVEVSKAHPKAAMWTHSPAMLRAYLALISATGTQLSGLHGVAPSAQDAHDIAHLRWLLREKGGMVDFAWALGNGAKPPVAVDASALTPVFAGAKLGVYEDIRVW